MLERERRPESVAPKNELAHAVDNVRSQLGDDWLPDVRHATSTEHAVAMVAEACDNAVGPAIVRACRTQLEPLPWTAEGYREGHQSRSFTVTKRASLKVVEYGVNQQGSVRSYGYGTLYVHPDARTPAPFDLDFVTQAVTPKGREPMNGIGATPTDRLHTLLDILLHGSHKENERVVSMDVWQKIDQAFTVIRRNPQVYQLRQTVDGHSAYLLQTQGLYSLIGLRFSSIQLFVETVMLQGNQERRQMLEFNRSEYNRVATGLVEQGSHSSRLVGNAAGNVLLHVAMVLEEALSNQSLSSYNPAQSKVHFKPGGMFAPKVE